MGLSPSARVLALLLALATLWVPLGCSRARYRRDADGQVQNLIDCGREPRWPLPNYTIEPSGESRMYDPYNPDCPPMPPDDPESHKLMHCVYCKKGWPCWHANGDTRHVENPAWRTLLPVDPNGTVIFDREGVVRLALLHSREYQQELEDLYLTALDVTFQRFRFDTQFFAGHKTTFTADGHLRRDGGGQSKSTLELNNDLKANDAQAKLLLATGGEFMAGVANSLVWQFSGPDEYSAFTLLDFSFVQPLLRAGGRAVALERLTDAERTLLANIRQMERFRRGFYVQLLNGRVAGLGPDRAGLALASLAPLTLATTGTGGSTSSLAGGFLGLVSESQAIRNQRINVVNLREAAERLEWLYTVGRLPDRFQVDFARQALYNAQSRLIGLEKAHQDRLDAYKIQLGLPPDVNARVLDPTMARFNMIDPNLTAAMGQISVYLAEVRDLKKHAGDAASLARWLHDTPRLRGLVEQQVATIAEDMRRLEDVLPARRKTLAELSQREEAKRGDVEADMVGVKYFDARIATLKADWQTVQAKITATLAELEQLRSQTPAPNASEEKLVDLRTRLEDAGGRLHRLVLDLSLLQARTRLDTVHLIPVAMDPAEAIEVARSNRLDWMNARSALVDQWRQIEIRANALQSQLDLKFSGDLGTTGNNPGKFTSTTGRMRVGLQFDAPLTRLAERNLYREALVDYQRARRAYYALEDRVYQGLRNTLRTIRLDQLNFEVRRVAVALAVQQVEATWLKLERPPKSVQEGQLSPTTARDLVQALQELLNSQDGIISVWLDYESQRINLDYDLGTMQLDERGMWIDPGAIEPGTLPTPPPEEIPAPESILQQLNRQENREGNHR